MLHADGVAEMLGYGWHVNLQKPMCNDLPEAQRMLDAARANDRMLRVMDNYLFYQPLHRLKAAAESGEIGEVVGYHMKMVGTGNGGWDVPWSSFEWQIDQMKRGRGIMVFDDGWHKLTTAIWLFGPDQGGPRLDREPRGRPGHRPRVTGHDHLGTRERRPRRVGHHDRHGHVPAFRLLHQ